MATGNIGHVPAATFAEYVDDPFFQPRDSAYSSQDVQDTADDAPKNAPSADSNIPLASNHASCVALRPALAHRLYSHRLHVRAKAKLHRDRLLSGPMMDVYVGEARRRWTLHRNLLCHHSEQLEAELDGADRKDSLELPDYAPAGFELLVKWLYQGTLDDVSDLAEAGQKYDYAVNCHQLYMLCDRFDMPQLKNVAMDQYRKGLNEAALVPDADEIDDIYRRSPLGSPFRRLMTRIAARQIMDPDSNRDVETYRQCFDNNPDFAVDLVNAIRHGTGGMLFDDPTDPGHECEYHDHEDGPNCNVKAKGKGKQARKAKASRLDQQSARSAPVKSSDRLLHPHRPPPPKILPPPPPRRARPQDGTGVGPLRRSLTSPAISTVVTSNETAVASQPPTPDATKDWEKLKKVITPEKDKTLQGQQAQTEKTRPALDERRRSSDDASRLLQASAASAGEGESPQQTHPRRGIWEWARVGTGRLGIIGRLPNSEWKSPTLSTAINGTPLNGTITEPHDDFQIPSTTDTEPNNTERQQIATAAKIEGLGISNIGTLHHSPSSFAQTKRSSDELIAAASETTGTPSPTMFRSDVWPSTTNHTTPSAQKQSPPTTPVTPTPPQRRSDSLVDPGDSTPTRSKSKSAENTSSLEHDTPASLNSTPSNKPPSLNGDADAKAENANATPNTSTPSPRHVATYKIALASKLLRSAGRKAST